MFNTILRNSSVKFVNNSTLNISKKTNIFIKFYQFKDLNKAI